MEFLRGKNSPSGVLRQLLQCQYRRGGGTEKEKDPVILSLTASLIIISQDTACDRRDVLYKPTLVKMYSFAYFSFTNGAYIFAFFFLDYNEFSFFFFV